MLINRYTNILGDKVILVPYRREHVLKYHGWMEDEQLRIQTGSERLTLEQEYDMQQSWLHDSDKLTFIILDRGVYEKTRSEVDSMIGDINLFTMADEPGELSLMIAEPSHRNQGKATESLRLFIRYCVNHPDLRMTKFIAKISEANSRSIGLFEKLHFVLESESSVFKEKTYLLEVTEEVAGWSCGQVVRSEAEIPPLLDR